MSLPDGGQYPEITASLAGYFRLVVPEGRTVEQGSVGVDSDGLAVNSYDASCVAPRGVSKETIVGPGVVAVFSGYSLYDNAFDADAITAAQIAKPSAQVILYFAEAERVTHVATDAEDNPRKEAGMLVGIDASGRVIVSW